MKRGKTTIYILIPAFNEEKHVGSVVRSLRIAGYKHIVIVNDGSNDQTEKVAKDAGAEVINHIINRGQGAALRTGIEYLRENIRPEVVVTFDADGQHRAKDIKSLIDPIMHGKYEVALGSRFLSSGTNLSVGRRVILKAAVLFTNLISNTNLTDTHNGLRALSLSALDKIDIRSRGMEHASEIIDDIVKHKLRYVEVPVRVIYSGYSRKKGQRTMNFWKIGLKFLIKKLA